MSYDLPHVTVMSHRFFHVGAHYSIRMAPMHSTAPCDTGGMTLQNFPERKECNHGRDSSVVDERGLVRRVKL
jgi:hypothetical protein